MKPTVIVWDLETVPDLAGFAVANDLVGKSDVEVREAIGEKVPNGENSQNGRYGILDRVTASVCLDVGGPDDLAPFLRFVGDELAKVSGREREHVATQVGKPRAHRRIGEAGIDCLIELVDYFGRRVAGRTDAVDCACFVAGQNVVHGRHVRQYRGLFRCGYRQRAQVAGFDVLD